MLHLKITCSKVLLKGSKYVHVALLLESTDPPTQCLHKRLWDDCNGMPESESLVTFSSLVCCTSIISLPSASVMWYPGLLGSILHPTGAGYRDNCGPGRCYHMTYPNSTNNRIFGRCYDMSYPSWNNIGLRRCYNVTHPNSMNNRGLEKKYDVTYPNSTYNSGLEKCYDMTYPSSIYIKSPFHLQFFHHT